eukprot:scaffold87647_cov58-Phaeocystis_antarctica.AAC.3
MSPTAAFLACCLITAALAFSDDPTAPPPSAPACGTCDAGLSCGICLRLVLPEKCPLSTSRDVAWNCEAAYPGEVCESNGECGTGSFEPNCHVIRGPDAGVFFERQPDSCPPSPP